MQTSGKSTCVLIVGDDLDTASFLDSSLTTLGFETERVASGIEALAELRSRHFELIISEFNMPKMGGEEFYAEIEKQCPWALRSICFLIDDHNPYGAQALLSRTRAHHLEKPFSFDQIAGVINDILTEQQKPSAA